MLNKTFHYIIFTVIIIFIYGCGGSKETVPPLMVSLSCDENCNESNAIVIRMYQLRNSDRFESKSFESLVRDPEAELEDDIVPETKFEKTMTPGEKIQIDKLQLKEGAIYLGVIGDFHSPAKDGWKTLIPLNAEMQNINIFIHNNFLSFNIN